MSAAGEPFSRRAALLLVAFGSLVFLAILLMSAFDAGTGDINDGGGHAGSRGINGFAAFADLAERRGYTVRRSRSEGAFEQPGLLVLTPPHMADPDKIASAIDHHRLQGPTILVLPKWIGVDASMLPGLTKTKEGWVILSGAAPPPWADEVSSLGDLDVEVDKLDSREAGWRGFGRAGRLPDARAVQTVSSGRVVAVVRDARGQTAAGFLDDGTATPDLEVAAGREPEAGLQVRVRYPVIVVAEPDLMDNWGMAEQGRAMAMLSLLNAATGGERMPVNFDLTLNGLGHSANLLALAFTPPFLAATLCLLLAALVIAWRAFVRFGPPLRPERAIAFGKQALVANSAGLVLRARRFHLLGRPYVERTRSRLIAGLALPRTLDSAAADAAIDRAAASRGEGADAFSGAAGRLLSAREPHQMVRAALDLHALERKLVR
ncbi:DUF4350 domain-containing protein [Novosphingobium aquimarinum]|uniref:DUF4350 domain-containing protein n=1 Tax=Novosphingobium aquimarinum TaxID=2682494 RepID=UPI0012EB6B9C|nr:DUF4350 domain-containing protein [Novosphingobium aquimarinum]